jgi:hypothetical protein
VPGPAGVAVSVGNDIFLTQEARLVGREAEPLHLRERVLLDMRVTYLPFT